VSVLAKGFDQLRWLAVAPDGDMFVADLTAGKVIVLLSSPTRGGAGSHEVLADHLNLPFGVAFRDDYVCSVNTNQVARFRYDPKTSQSPAPTLATSPRPIRARQAVRACAVEHATREEQQLSERRHFVGRRDPEKSETRASSPRKTPHGSLSSWQG